MYVKFIKDDKVVEEVSISPEIIPLPTDIVVLEAGKFTVESREYDILDGTCSVILAPGQKLLESTTMLCLLIRSAAITKLTCQLRISLKQDGKLWAVKHVKDSAKCGLKEAKDFVDTYCDYVLND